LEVAIEGTPQRIMRSSRSSRRERENFHVLNRLARFGLVSFRAAPV
jgi:hypothetical protein